MLDLLAAGLGRLNDFLRDLLGLFAGLLQGFHCLLRGILRGFLRCHGFTPFEQNFLQKSVSSSLWIDKLFFENA